jgi:GxxExxY protein|tara:strand:- start:13848 stop:14183 length:336 start_codon:yes stop_codon:yes gene_type:complete
LKWVLKLRLGHGIHEKPYKNALCVELGLRKTPWCQQPRFDVRYKTLKVGEYVPDLIVFEKVIVDTKVIERIGQYEIAQMLNYLKVTGLPVGLILNFKRSKLEWKRVIRDKT